MFIQVSVFFFFFPPLLFYIKDWTRHVLMISDVIYHNVLNGIISNTGGGGLFRESFTVL